MALLIASLSIVTPSPLAPKSVTSKTRAGPPAMWGAGAAPAAVPAPTSGNATPAAPAAPHVTTRRRLMDSPTAGSSLVECHRCQLGGSGPDRRRFLVGRK